MFDSVVRVSLAVAALVLLVVTGCGGVQNEPNLAKAIERTEATGSSAFALTVVQVTGGGSEEVHCEGEADYAAERMRMSCGGGAEFVAVGDVYYARGWFSAQLGLPPDPEWVRVPIEEDEGSPNDIAPGALLGKLRAASLDTERLAEEDVRGEETVRYRMTVSCDDADLTCPGETTEVDVWIDGDGLVRRAALEDDGADITAEFFDFGIAVEVAEPPADQIGDLANPSFEACSGGGTPVTDARLRRALRAHGLEVDDDDGRCFTGVAAQIAAVLESMPNDPADSGGVLCYVYRAADRDAPAAVEDTSGFGVAGLRLRNVVCSAFGGDPSGGAAIQRLRDALDEIARWLRP